MKPTMTLAELAETYKVSTRTMKRKIKKLNPNIDTSSLLYPKDLCAIIQVIGEPHDLENMLSHSRVNTTNEHSTKPLSNHTNNTPRHG